MMNYMFGLILLSVLSIKNNLQAYLKHPIFRHEIVWIDTLSPLDYPLEDAIIYSKNVLLKAPYFYFYRFSEVKNLPLQSFVTKVTIGGEEVGSEERIETRQVKGYDLNKLRPVSSFHLPRGIEKKKDINSYSFQGFDVDGGRIVFYEGVSESVLKMLEEHGVEVVLAQ